MSKVYFKYLLEKLQVSLKIRGHGFENKSTKEIKQ